jgi:hypothetical protein
MRENPGRSAQEGEASWRLAMREADARRGKTEADLQPLPDGTPRGMLFVFPVEQVLTGLPRLTNVRSVSKFGLSQVVLLFEDGTDIYFARQQVLERLQTVDLPDGVKPTIGALASPVGEIYRFHLKSDSLSPTELRSIQDWLQNSCFQRVHRNAIVNINHVRKISVLSSQRWLLTLSNMQELVVSKRQAGGVRRMLHW